MCNNGNKDYLRGGIWLFQLREGQLAPGGPQGQAEGQRPLPAPEGEPPWGRDGDVRLCDGVDRDFQEAGDETLSRRNINLQLDKIKERWTSNQVTQF